MAATSDAVAAIQAADMITWRIEPHVCDQCETTCYSLEGRAQGDMGPEIWDTSIAWATHVSLATAMGALMRTLGSQLSRVKQRESAVLLRETQRMLW